MASLVGALFPDASLVFPFFVAASFVEGLFAGALLV